MSNTTAFTGGVETVTKLRLYATAESSSTGNVTFTPIITVSGTNIEYPSTTTLGRSYTQIHADINANYGEDGEYSLAFVNNLVAGMTIDDVAYNIEGRITQIYAVLQYNPLHDYP
jgi:hypothetical protein